MSNVPILSDVFTMNQVIRYLNTDVEFNEEAKEIKVNATRQLNGGSL